MGMQKLAEHSFVSSDGCSASCVCGISVQLECDLLTLRYNINSRQSWIVRR